MSMRYKGGVISATPPTTDTYTAPGIWTLEQQMQAQKGSVWPLASDPYFNYVTMLLHGDGTNGAQNNTFLDSSSNAFSITRNGNTTQGTFSPYGANWSNYFNGSSYLTAPSNAAFDFGSGDFTIEAWVVPTSYYQSGNAGVIGRQPGGGVYGPWLLTFSGSLQPLFVVSNNGSSWAFVLVSSVSCVLGAWNHIAITRSGTTFTIWVNGVSGGTSTLSGSLISSSSAVTVGSEAVGGAQPYNGWISNVRVVKGTAVYTSAFTPSTTPLTAISGTSLLTCQSNRFIDNSSNSFTITAGGSPSVQRFSPFAPTSAYSPSVIGGSGYFPGSSYLTAPDNAAFEVAANDFTLECFAYFTTSATQSGLISKGTTTGATYLIYHGGGNEVSFYASSDGSSWNVSAGAQFSGNIPLNAWHHIAVTRSGTTFRLFLNGTQTATFTSSASLYNNTSTFNIGTFSTAFTGYISNVRLVNGTSLYNANFTPSTTPLTAVANTAILTNFTNSGILDNAEMNDLETVGNAQVSTSVVKYGTGSMAFDGTGDYLVTPTSVNSAFGTGDFTIEMWLYANNFSGGPIFLDYRPDGVNGVYPTLYFTSGGVLTYFTNSADRITSSALSTGTWYHIALCRGGSSTKLFVNGTQAGSTYTDTNSYLAGTSRPLIGANGASLGTGLNGYLDDLRITKGYARYTANFTPPTGPFQNN